MLALLSRVRVVSKGRAQEVDSQVNLVCRRGIVAAGIAISGIQTPEPQTSEDWVRQSIDLSQGQVSRGAAEQCRIQFRQHGSLTCPQATGFEGHTSVC